MADTLFANLLRVKIGRSVNREKISIIAVLMRNHEVRLYHQCDRPGILTLRVLHHYNGGANHVQ